MLNNVKAMIVVLSIASMVFVFAKPVCLQFMQEKDFLRRRNIWFLLTIVAFLSPSFWIFALVTVTVLFWASKHDSNPLALYVIVMHVISPNTAIPLPVIGGINELFDVNIYRLVNLALLVPLVMKSWSDKTNVSSRTRVLMNVLLISYICLQLALLTPYESITNTLRRGTLAFLDLFILYYAVSRSLPERSRVVEILACFCLICGIFSPLAVFESMRGWLLYQGIGDVWGAPDAFPYLLRGTTLRAPVSAGHAIPLGFMIAVALGFWFYLATLVKSRRTVLIVGLTLIAGLLAAYSRSPWLAAVFIYFIYSALSPNGMKKVVASLAVTIPLAVLALLSPYGGRIIDNLPFIGTINAETVDYRQQLAEKSWELIKANPFFGDPFFMLKLESMRQGQGIIDLMNAYAAIAMQFGVVTLCVLLGFFLAGLRRAINFSRQSMELDVDLSRLGAIIGACMLGTMFMMATGGLGVGVAQVFFMLAGFAAANFWTGQRAEPPPSSTAPKAMSPV